MALCVADEHLRQRADLHRLTFVSWRLNPGILPVSVPFRELRLSLALPRVQRLFAVIVGVGYIFCYRLAENRIRRSLERLHATDVTMHDDAAGQIVCATAAVERQIGDGKIIRYSAA